MDKMREEFEDWYRNHMLNDEREHFAVIESTIDSYKHDRDKYGYSDIQEMWLSWKASRASLCVELPCGYIGHPYRSEILSAIDSCRIALDDAGVSCK